MKGTGGAPCPEYLASDKGTLRAVQLKFKLRTGVLCIGADLHRQHRDPGLCKLCNVFGTAKHIIFQCPAFNKERQIMLTYIKANVHSDIFYLFIQDMDSMCFLRGP